MVMVAVPATFADELLMLVMVAAAAYRKAPDLVTEPLGPERVILATPVPAGAVALIWSSPTSLKVAVVEPNLTEVMSDRFTPLMVTVVPPEVEPTFG